jgi:hypothetical protein
MSNKPDLFEKDESWIKSYWRPAMGWQYFSVCLFDFLLAPIFTAWYSWFTQIPYQVWKPITLGEGGFYHMAMAAIVGVVAWTRGQEKVSEIREVGRIERVEEVRRHRANIQPATYDPRDPSIPPNKPDN